MRFSPPVFLAVLLAGGAASALSFKTPITLQSPNPSADDRFGWSVAAVGDGVLIGTPNMTATYSGAAYLFQPVPEPSA